MTRRDNLARIGPPDVLRWAADAPDLAVKLGAELGLDRVQVVQAMRYPPGDVEGAALKTLFMARQIKVESAPAYFFSTLFKGKGFGPEEIAAYLEDMAYLKDMAAIEAIETSHPSVDWLQRRYQEAKGAR